MPADLLPSSLPTVRRGGVYRNGAWWVTGHCMNCGVEGGSVPETGEIYFVCELCSEKWQAEFDTKLVPDEVFAALVIEEQLERDGRVLSPLEQIDQLTDPNSYLSILARSRP